MQPPLRLTANPRCPLCSRPLRAFRCPVHGLPGDVEPTVKREAAETAQLFDADDTTARSDALVGTRIGEYVVKRRIGAGGMGIVYEGEQPLIQRRVAIKILRPELSSTPAEMNALLAEARTANSVQHRGIISVFGFGELPGAGQYMVMEYLDGVPLNELVAERAPMILSEAAPILDDALAALEAAHARGVIHRDLKPSNIFLVTESNGTRYAKLLDFGLAKVSALPGMSTPQTRESVVVGTPEYMAPEQACGKPVGPQTDLYALGVVAFEMLTGRLPFEGEHPLDIAMKQVNAPPPRLGEVVRDPPEALELLVAHLLEKSPEKRPASAQVVRRELARITREAQQAETRMGPRPGTGTADQRLLVTDRIETPDAGAMEPRKPPRALAALMGILIAGALGAAALSFVARPEERPADAGPVPTAVATREAAPEPRDPEPDAPTPEPLTVDEPEAVRALPAAASAASEAPTVPVVRRAAKPPSKPPGELVVVLRGAGLLKIDGKERGRIPPTNRVKLAPGSHLLEILSPVAKPYRTHVTVESGKVLEWPVRLQPLD